MCASNYYIDTWNLFTWQPAWDRNVSWPSVGPPRPHFPAPRSWVPFLWSPSVGQVCRSWRHRCRPPPAELYVRPTAHLAGPHTDTATRESALSLPGCLGIQTGDDACYDLQLFVTLLNKKHILRPTLSLLKPLNWFQCSLKAKVHVQADLKGQWVFGRFLHPWTKWPLSVIPENNSKSKQPLSGSSHVEIIGKARSLGGKQRTDRDRQAGRETDRLKDKERQGNINSHKRAVHIRFSLLIVCLLSYIKFIC